VAHGYPASLLSVDAWPLALRFTVHPTLVVRDCLHSAVLSVPEGIDLTGLLGEKMTSFLSNRKRKGNDLADGGLVTFSSDFFSFLYFKKLKFQKYMAVLKNFKTIPLSPPACRPLVGRQDLNVKKNLHLGPGTKDALNSELVK